jgi:hypothetical protein
MSEIADLVMPALRELQERMTTIEVKLDRVESRVERHERRLNLVEI